MFSKKTKLDQEDLEELRKRTELINQHILISQALEAQKQQFLMSRFSKYGLDITKQYDIELKTGRVTEAKTPQKK